MGKILIARQTNWLDIKKWLTSAWMSLYWSTRLLPSAAWIFGSSDPVMCSAIRHHVDWPGHHGWVPSLDCIKNGSQALKQRTEERKLLTHHWQETHLDQRWKSLPVAVEQCTFEQVALWSYFIVPREYAVINYLDLLKLYFKLKFQHRKTATQPNMNEFI